MSAKLTESNEPNANCAFKSPNLRSKGILNNSYYGAKGYGTIDK